MKALISQGYCGLQSKPARNPIDAFAWLQGKAKEDLDAKIAAISELEAGAAQLLKEKGDETAQLQGIIDDLQKSKKDETERLEQQLSDLKLAKVSFKGILPSASKKRCREISKNGLLGEGKGGGSQGGGARMTSAECQVFSCINMLKERCVTSVCL